MRHLIMNGWSIYYISTGELTCEVMDADAELRKTGLERSERIAKDVKWFEQQGYAIPQPSSLGINYLYQFLCHFYMIYFGHTAGGRMIGKKVSQIHLDLSIIQ